MTASTEKERAEFEALVSEKWPGITLIWSGGEFNKYMSFDVQAKWEIWQAARRAPAVAVTQEPTSKQVVLGAGALLGQPENTADNRHPDWHSAVEKARNVYLAMLAAAPQPPETAQLDDIGVADMAQAVDSKEVAPVQMPEPLAKIEGGSLKWHIPDVGYSLPVRYLQGTQMLYTEQQLRELLANHGIKEQST